MTLVFFVLIQYQSVTDVTDGRTDRQADRHIFSGYISDCIACYDTALVKMHDCSTCRFLYRSRPQTAHTVARDLLRGHVCYDNELGNELPVL